MNRRVIGAILAVVLAVVGTFVLVSFVNRAEDRALEGEKVVKVFVVKQRIPAGTSGGEVEQYVEEERVPTKVRAEGSVSRLSRLEDRVAATDLLPGEQLVLDRWVEPRSFDSTPSRIGVPQGKVEVTFAVEPERALG
jgi:pilus assembly protein CpaB